MGKAQIRSSKIQTYISGIGASPGEAIGRVKIVLNIGELEKISYGDILVAPMTNPDYVLAMKKCAAIVTDSGGITCHAAIISRELKIPEYVRKLLFSNLDERLSLELCEQREDGKKWIEMLRTHAKKWWWVRERDPYFDPISDEVGMFSFIRKFATPHISSINFKENKKNFKNTIEIIKQKLDNEEFDKFEFLLECGRILNRERDNHHYIWIKSISIIRKFFLEVGDKFKKLQLIDHEKDVFFLTIPEIISLLNNPTSVPKEELSRKINKRIAHIKEKTKLTLHKEVKEQPPEFFDDIF